jgi:hypothetical protein
MFEHTNAKKKGAASVCNSTHQDTLDPLLRYVYSHVTRRHLPTKSNSLSYTGAETSCDDSGNVGRYISVLTCCSLGQCAHSEFRGASLPLTIFFPTLLALAPHTTKISWLLTLSSYSPSPSPSVMGACQQCIIARVSRRLGSGIRCICSHQQTRCSLTGSARGGICSACQQLGRRCRPRVPVSQRSKTPRTADTNFTPINSNSVPSVSAPSSTKSHLSPKTGAPLPESPSMPYTASPHTFEVLVTLDRPIRKISLAIDFGTQNTAAVFKFHYRDELDPQPGQEDLLSTFETVVWPDGEREVRTELAYQYPATEDASSEALPGPFRQLWGSYVDRSISARVIPPERRMRWLKLAILDSSERTRPDRDTLLKQIWELPPFVRRSRVRSPKSPMQGCDITPYDLVSDFLGHVWRWSLTQMADRRPDLPWSGLDLMTADQGFDPTRYFDFDVTIACPALSTPEFVQLIVSAAKECGMPEPLPVSEPVCASQLLFQKQFERVGKWGAPPPLQTTSLVADTGAGTSDMQIQSVLGVRPLRVKEEVRGRGKSVMSCHRVVRKN